MPSDKRTLTFRAQPHLDDQVDAYAELKDISKSEALRRIVERGVDDVLDTDLNDEPPETSSRRFGLSKRAGLSVGAATLVFTLLNTMMLAVGGF